MNLGTKYHATVSVTSQSLPRNAYITLGNWRLPINQKGVGSCTLLLWCDTGITCVAGFFFFFSS